MRDKERERQRERKRERQRERDREREREKSNGKWEDMKSYQLEKNKEKDNGCKGLVYEQIEQSRGEEDE